ncbi:hypothetical protein BW731_00290 [Vagococcus martis]|uniref:Uncharacterized protein n=1 Tax=Vagococcus martis TaxID=1768210 RepID=A0A1V4DE19_9ENTE|nr:hypothetical protein [Vagococcus martis]OPF86742.1 hypothetical protein BW731_00290 [Vagococcus martis]
MKLSKKDILWIIVLVVALVSYGMVLLPLINKIEKPEQADAILQIITTLIGGVLSGLVAYFIASLELKNYKKEQILEKKESEILDKRNNLERIKRLLIEVEDNNSTCQELIISKENLNSAVTVIRLSVSDFFWKLNSNKIDVNIDLLIELNMYYKNIFIIQTTDMGNIDLKFINSFMEKQVEVISLLNQELVKAEQEISERNSD